MSVPLYSASDPNLKLSDCSSWWQWGLTPRCWSMTPGEWNLLYNNVAVPPAPTGAMLTQNPTSADQAQAVVNNMINQQMVNQQRIDADQVSGNLVGQVTGTISDTLNPLLGFDWSSSLPYIIVGGLLLVLAIRK